MAHAAKAHPPAAAVDALPVALSAPLPVATPGTAIDARATGAAMPDAAARTSAVAADGGDELPPAPEIDAFHGQLPALPMLSADGKVAALDVSEGLGLSSFHTYEVAFTEAGGHVRERIAVVDQALAEALLADGRRADGASPMKIPAQRLARAAAKIAQRLAAFTPFAREFDADAIGRAGGELALGGATLAFHGDETAGLELRLVGADGAVVRRDRIPVRPRQFTDRDGGRCGGPPRLTGVWWDPARRRAALQIIFPGHDSCEDEPALWLVW